MPEHVAVRCYSCQAFQAQQLRKTNDFICKMCGAKQSVRKIYARSFKASDIRPVVQEYNMKRGDMEEDAAASTLQRALQREEGGSASVPQRDEPSPHTARANEWTAFLDEVPHCTHAKTGTELLTALPEYKRTAKSGNAAPIQSSQKWSSQPKRGVTGVKRKWAPSPSDSSESAPKHARYETVTPRLISTAQLAGSRPGPQPGPVSQPGLGTDTQTPGTAHETSAAVIDKIRAAASSRVPRTVGASSSVTPHTVSNVSSKVPSVQASVKKSEWDDYVDDEGETNDACQEQDGGELLFAADDELQPATDEW